MNIKENINKLFSKANQPAKIKSLINYSIYLNRRQYLEEKILNSTKPGVSAERYCNHEIIVSLTTYGKRIYDVCFAIESIMQQTMLPNRIVLNLDFSLKDKRLPLALQRQMKRGLEVDFTEDIRSYKKLIPTLIKYPDAIIITIDDDLLYNFDIIERLFNSYCDNPDKINALRTHTITFDKNEHPLSYDEWNQCSASTDNPFHLFPTTGGGTLFPPGCFSGDVTDKDVFMTLCPTADDVWVHAMAVKNGTEIVKVESRTILGEDYIINYDVQDINLLAINSRKKGGNDEQLKAVYEKYGIFNLLKKGNDQSCLNRSNQ